MQISVIILAAGQGSRMKSDLPKVLHRVGSAPLLHHAMKAASALSPSRMVIVAGHGAERVSAAAHALDPGAEIVLQGEQRGTAHAVDQARSLLADELGDVIVLYGDTPFIRPETLRAMQEARSRHDVVILGFASDDPGLYGRLIMHGDELLAIREYKDASEVEREIMLCNSGVICASARQLFGWIAEIGNENASGEYYLTDVIGIAHRHGASAGVVFCPESETLGVNDRQHLAEAEAGFQARARAQAMENGVTLTAPETVFFALDTMVGQDSIIGPNVIFGPNVRLDPGVEIKGFCHLEGCHVSGGADLGPFSRIRPGADLGPGVHVGNFVEVKNSRLHQGVKVGHLSYIGDAEIGAATNIGAGTITCNYDGVMKHRTTIGKDVFIGSDTMLVAPVTIGDGALTASGSVITQDVPAGALAIARARQELKHGFVARFFDRLRMLKTAKAKE